MGTLLPDPLNNPPSPAFPVRACLCLNIFRCVFVICCCGISYPKIQCLKQLDYLLTILSRLDLGNDSAPQVFLLHMASSGIITGLHLAGSWLWMEYARRLLFPIYQALHCFSKWLLLSAWVVRASS